jgi:predicted transcriptional regulator
MAIERRDKRRRLEVIRLVVDQIVHNPESSVTIQNLRDFLNIPDDAARRIIDNLVKAGLMYEMRPGVWARRYGEPLSGEHVANYIAVCNT